MFRAIYVELIKLYKITQHYTVSQEEPRCRL